MGSRAAFQRKRNDPARKNYNDGWLQKKKGEVWGGIRMVSVFLRAGRSITGQ